MTVAILTMFSGLDTTYSLVGAVAEQLTMLLNAGVQTRVLVSEDCPDDARTGVFADDRLEWVKITNRLGGEKIHWRDYSQPDGEVHGTFDAEAEAISEEYIKALLDVSVCILHDILYQGWHLIHNAALRLAQKQLPNVRFLACTHSLPVNPPLMAKPPFSYRYTPMPRTLYLYPTQSGIPALARQYDVPEGRCRVVSNSINALSFLHEAVSDVHAHTDILSPDVLIVYPGRLTPGKQPEKVAALAGILRAATEQTVKVIYCDFPSADIDPASYKARICATGRVCGLSETDLLFTSDIGYARGFPRKAVLDLFTLSNLFICPSRSESFGLTVLEAASRGNMLVLNEAVPALEELGKRLHAYFMRWDARNFGYDTKESYQPNEIAYLKTHALAITEKLRADAAIYAKTLARQRFSPSWVWRNQLEPLINGQ